MGQEEAERGQWSGKLDFLLSCLGYAVGKNLFHFIKKVPNIYLIVCKVYFIYIKLHDSKKMYLQNCHIASFLK